MTPEEILGSLNPEQAEAAGTIEGPVLVLAGAGTGKTRVITCRIAYMLAKGIDPGTILGLTFTNKAAREMRERLKTLVAPEMAAKVTLGTFHAFCVRVLRRDITRLGYLQNFTIADDSDQQGLLRQASANLGYDAESYALPELGAAIGRWKNRLVGPAAASRTADTPLETIASQLYRNYQELLELQNMIDFDDMLLLVHRLFDEFPEVLARYRETYRYLLIDEYQDTNDAQFKLVEMLAAPRNNLCVVGDDDQSIYSWRGANISNILSFPDFFPGTKVAKLEQNYRSTGKILDAANAVIGGNARRHGKNLWSALGEGEKVTLSVLEDGPAEARFIADMVMQMMADDPSLGYADFAVLYRSNHLSRELETAFRQAHVPYRLVGGQEFYQRKEIKDAVAYLKLLVNPRENQSLLRILGIPPRGLGETAVKVLKRLHLERHCSMVQLLDNADFLSALTPKAAEAARHLAGIFREYSTHFALPGGLAGRVREFLLAVGYLDGLQRIYKDIKDAEKRRENVEEFISAIAQYEQRAPAPPTLETYLESFALLEENDRTREEDAEHSATLCTVHAAKGLEFPIVFVVALEQGIFPHERAIAEGSSDEELRLFYVAITRARKRLFLLRARQRLQRGFQHPQKRSQFLGLLPEEAATQVESAELFRAATSDELYAAFSRFFNPPKK